jgi:signal transduction histidine kinase
VRVADDGRGAPPEAFESATAYGVMGMRERALSLGGQLAIASAPGQGSTFTLSLPLHHG